jgi:hypothetical protein
MRKLLIVLIVSFFALNFVLAENIVIPSDDTTLWSGDGLTWFPTVNTYVHPQWPSILGAYWIWRTNLTDTQQEYLTVPEGGWYFKKTFNISECADAESISGNISVGVDNAYQLYFNGAYIGGQGVMNKNGPEIWSEAYTWRNITTYQLNGFVPGENEISFRALNYLSSGGSFVNPAGLIFKIQFELDENLTCQDEDEHKDEGVELCQETYVDVPSAKLGTNRWIWNGNQFVTRAPKGKGPEKTYTLNDTRGCSCFQILSWLNENYPEEYGNMEGHWKHGCSSSVMDAFIERTA